MWHRIAGSLLLSLSLICPASETHIGVGVGAQYSGVGMNIGVLANDNKPYVSVGCSSFSRSGRDDRFSATCGLGVGFLKSGLFSMDVNHALGVHAGAEKETDGTGPVNYNLYGQYIYYFNWNQRGWNLGVAPGVKYLGEKDYFSFRINTGYQF